jgi:hypothetical protein
MSVLQKAERTIFLKKFQRNFKKRLENSFRCGIIKDNEKINVCCGVFHSGIKEYI